MPAFHEYIQEYKKQIKKGAIQKAYQGLVEYIMDLRTHLQKKYPDYSISGSIYYGYMDMTYFSFFPEAIKARKLKIAIVFLHEAFRFEVWLAASNKQVQSTYWKIIRDSGWDRYQLVTTIQGADAIIEHVLVDNPDFYDLDALTRQIELNTLSFIEEVETFLSQYPS